MSWRSVVGICACRAGDPGRCGAWRGCRGAAERVFGSGERRRGRGGCGSVRWWWSGGGRERADAGERFGEGVAPGPAGWEVKGVAPGGLGESAG